MQDPTLILHGNKIQGNCANNPKVIPVLQFSTSQCTSDEQQKCPEKSPDFLANIKLMIYTYTYFIVGLQPKVCKLVFSLSVLNVDV